MPRRLRRSGGPGGAAGPAEAGTSESSEATAEQSAPQSTPLPPPLSPLPTCAVFALVFALYAATVYPSTPGGDSGELIAVANSLGVAHPPGYPLFTLLTKAAIAAIPGGSVAWRANMLSAAFAAAAAALLFHAAALACQLQLPSQPPGLHLAAGLIATALFAFSRLTWMYSVAAEVFALNNLFVALLLLLLLRFLARPSPVRAYLLAFACALALTNQHTSVLYIVILAPYVVWYRRDELLAPAPILTFAAVVLLGLSPYAYMVWSACGHQAELTWGDQCSVSGFFTHLLRKEYGTFSLANSEATGTSAWTALRTHAEAFHTETLYLGLPLAAASLLPWPAERPAPAAAHATPLLWVMLAFYLFFFNWRANLDLSNPLLAGVHERFWMQPNMLLCLFAGTGAVQLLSRLPARITSALPSTALALGALLAALLIGHNFAARDESANDHTAGMGRSLLEPLPPNAILLTLGDLPGNAARYVQKCENVRRDVRLIDLEMMTFEWYLPMLEHTFPGVVFPARKKVYRMGPDHFDMRKFFDANYDNFPIFVFEKLNPDDHTYQDKYELWEFGLTKRIVRKGDTLNITAYIAESMAAIPHRPLPDPVKYDERTWEHVIYEGYLAAPVHLGIQFESMARNAAPKQALELNRAAYDIYSMLLAERGPQMVFWHKNFGLIAHNLFQATHDVAFARKRHEQWTAYLAANPDDAQLDSIRAVLEQDRHLLGDQQ